MARQTFFCDRCKQEKTHDSEFTTGYGVTLDNEKHCFQCCAEIDAEELEKSGKGFFYLSKNLDGSWKVTNWPGTFKVPVQNIRISDHNFAGRNGRRDVWFNWHGSRWHGVNIGDNQIVRVKRIKSV